MALSTAKAPATTAPDTTEGATAWTNINNTQAEDASYANALVAINPAGVSQTKAPGLGQSVEAGFASWAYPMEILVPNGVESYAYITNGGYSDYLLASNFGFSIPSNATITGVKVRMLRRGEYANAIYDSEVYLRVDGALGGENKASVNAWASTETYNEFGGDGDTWGLGLTPAKINAAEFGVYLLARNANAPTKYAYVDYVEIIVYYTPGATAAVYSTVKLVSGGTIVGDDKATGGEALTAVNDNTSFGGATVLWGTSLNSNIVNASNFGVVVNFVGSGGLTANYQTYLIKATNFGFTIPIGAVVRGVVARIKGKLRANVSEATFNSYVDIDFVELTVYYDLPACGIPPDF